MRMTLAPLLLLAVIACANTHGTRRFSRHVPPAEAAWFKIEFNQEFPDQGKEKVSGGMASAIQIAMDDFLPWRDPPSGEVATELEADAICLSQRQSWDIWYRVSPADGKVMLISIAPAPGACRRGPPIMDQGATYAVDTRTESILAVQTATWQILPRALTQEAARAHFPGQLEARRGYTRIQANMAAAIQLALEDFRPKDASTPPGTFPGDACLYQRRSYDVTAAPVPDAIMLVRFDINDEECPPSAPPTVLEGVKHYQPVETPMYAIDSRTMRILTYASYPRERSHE
jgi:hypothetical protein